MQFFACIFFFKSIPSTEYSIQIFIEFNTFIYERFAVINDTWIGDLCQGIGYIYIYILAISRWCMWAMMEMQLDISKRWQNKHFAQLKPEPLGDMSLIVSVDRENKKKTSTARKKTPPIREANHRNNHENDVNGIGEKNTWEFMVLYADLQRQMDDIIFAPLF